MDSTEVVLPPCMMQQIASPLTCHSDQVKTDLPPVTKKQCPWGKISCAEVVSFNDVMSEQLAGVLQHEEEIAAYPKRFSDVPRDVTSEDSDICDDFLLAQITQLEFDKQHDEILKQEVKKYNGASKVSVSFDKYLRLQNPLPSDDEDDEDNDYLLEQNAKKHWENFDQAKKVLQAVGKSGVSRQGSTTTTKHDTIMCGRRNACKLMEFPSGIDTGDSFDLRISNNVYNALKLHSVAEERRNYRVHDKIEKATNERALDEKTRLVLYKLVNTEVVDIVNGCLSTGKEACVYHASSAVTKNSPASEYAVKIFKTTLNEYKNRDQYIKEDYRFKDRFSRQNPRKVIHLWAEKEMRNLMRIHRADIPCPEVIALKKHILVMSFIGRDNVPAPKLKEVKVPFQDFTLMYEQTTDIMKKLYHKCHLVHADLSEYNLLWHDDKVWVIDVSQAVEITHPRSHEFLIRDCQNITSFFEKQGVIDVLKPEALFAEICGQVVPLKKF